MIGVRKMQEITLNILKARNVKFGYDEFASTVDGFRPEKGQCDCLAK